MLGGLTFDPKGLVLAHGQRRQVQLLGVRVIDEIKPVLLKDFHAVAERELLRHGEPHWQRPQQGLPVELANLDAVVSFFCMFANL